MKLFNHIWNQYPVPALLLFGFTMFFVAPVWFTDRDFAGADFQQIHYPLLKFVVDSVRDSGHIPLWNPHQFLGYSVVGNPQYGLFYPPNWLLLLFAGDRIYDGIGLLIGLHLFWLALGMYTFVRQWNCTKSSALIAGLMVGFGGFPISKLYAGHYAVLLTIAWLPWILVALNHALQKQTWRSILPVSATLGLSILAGHPQFVYISGFAMLALLVHHLAETSSWSVQGRMLGQFAAIGILAVVLGAIVLLPVYDYQSQTVRGQASDSLNFANQHAIPLRQLTSIFVADLFGTPTTETGYRGEPFYEEMTMYVGLLPFILLYFVAINCTRGLWFAGGLILIGLWMSIGSNAGLYLLQYYLVPPARGFRAPGRFLLLAMIGLALLTALVITRLQQDSSLIEQYLSRWLRRIFLPGLIIAAGGALLFSLLGTEIQQNDAYAAHIARQLAISALFLIVYAGVFILWSRVQPIAIGLLVVVCAANIWWMSAPIRNIDRVEISPVWTEANTLLPDDNVDAYARIFQTGQPPGIINGASWIGEYSPQGYDPIAPAGWFELMDATGRFIEEPGSATNRLFSVKYVVAGQPLENYGFATGPFFEPLNTDEPFYFYENPQPLSRAYIAGAFSVESNTTTALQRIQAGEVDRGDLVLLPETPDCDVTAGTASAMIIRYMPNAVDISVTTDSTGILVLADQYDPDWQVFVDNERAELLQVNTTFRGVCVPEGSYQVEFRYRPLWFYRGAVLSGIGWVLCGVLMAAGITYNRKSLKASN